MKAFSVIPFIIPVLWGSASFAVTPPFIEEPITVPSTQTPGDPNVQDLDGKELVVRVYNDWQREAGASEVFSVKISRGMVDFRPNNINDKALVIVVGADQLDPIVKHYLEGVIFTTYYGKEHPGLSLRIEKLKSHRKNWWDFKDALGEPIPNATVEICLWAEGKSPKFAVAEGHTDEDGRLEVPAISGVLRELCLIISHPKYGIASVRRGGSYRSSAIFVLPLVRAGTAARGRTARGTVLGPEGNPVAGAAVRCHEAYTLGGGLILNSRFGEVLTDDNGVFCFYLTNEVDPRRSDRGKLVPPATQYYLRVKPPEDLSLMPYEGMVSNTTEAKIILDRPQCVRKFAFWDYRGPLTDPEILQSIRLKIERPGKRPLHFCYSDFENSHTLPAGKYTFATVVESRWYEFEPLDVCKDSPAELRLTLKEGFLCCGSVIHGVTGKPLQGVFVIGKSSICGGHNLCEISPRQWSTLHSLPSHPSVNDANLGPLEGVYIFDEVVRTDENGRFEINFRPGGEFYELVIFEQDYLAVKRKVPASGYTPNRRIEMPVTTLFPSATVSVAAAAGDSFPVIEANWHINKEECPIWARGLLSIGDDPEICFAHRPWDQNSQTLPVPAGLNFQIRIRAKWDRRWCPLTVDQAIYLTQGQTLELGLLALQPMVNVTVKVVNSRGEPVEGVPVKWTAAGSPPGPVANTNEDGMAILFVPPHLPGAFVVDAPMHWWHLQEKLPYQIGGQESNGTTFTMTISDTMVQNLFR